MKNYPTLKPTLPAGTKVTVTALKKSIQEFGKLVGKGRETGRLGIGILDGGRRRHFVIELQRGKHSVKTTSDARNDFEILCDKDVYVAMAGGELSPAEAFLTGRLQVRGGLGFAKRMYARAARGKVN